MCIGCSAGRGFAEYAGPPVPTRKGVTRAPSALLVIVGGCLPYKFIWWIPDANSLNAQAWSAGVRFAAAWVLVISAWVSLLLVMMVTSKGIAGVPRASLVVVAATLPMFDLPGGGLLLILGIDQFLDMGRTMTNVIGNGLATAAVAKWEGELIEAARESDNLVPALAG